MSPRATYRVQFHKGFTFADGERLAPYLHQLGISHLYSSPILTARAGSNHGYDVVDVTRINPELGGEAAFRAMASALDAQGIGLIIDIVPNHMAVGGADNAFWLDVLKHGRESRYASWFDIDFDVLDTDLCGKVLAPYLGDVYEDVLAGGELRLADDPDLGMLAVAYHHHRFPIRPEDEAEIRQNGLEAYRDAEKLDDLLERQNFRLAWWRTAGDRVNYRRFFDITELAGVRIENADAFEALHEIAFGLYEDGTIAGVRVDHIDGLSDPAAYCRKLRERLDLLQPRRPGARAGDRAYVVVEKILASSEYLAIDWSVDGTTGYDFMNEVSALQHHGAAADRLGRLWSSMSGRSLDFKQEEDVARREMLDVNFNGQCDTVVDQLYNIAARTLHDRDMTRAAIRRAVIALIRHFRVYRSYATGAADSPGAGLAFEAALDLALADPAPERRALTFIRSVIDSRDGDSDTMRAIRRFNQLTAPVAAKSVEDTAFYRYGRLISRNDVGFDADRLAMSAAEFHGRMQRRATDAPCSMLASATHDHKRGEDVRARLAALSELPEEWAAAATRWIELNASASGGLSDRGDEYQLYQTLVGAWPVDLAADDRAGLQAFRERVAGWREKSLREAKLRSTWIAPNEPNEAAATEFLSAILDPSRSTAFLQSVTDFVSRLSRGGCHKWPRPDGAEMPLPGLARSLSGDRKLGFQPGRSRQPPACRLRSAPQRARRPTRLAGACRKLAGRCGQGAADQDLARFAGGHAGAVQGRLLRADRRRGRSGTACAGVQAEHRRREHFGGRGTAPCQGYSRRSPRAGPALVGGHVSHHRHRRACRWPWVGRCRHGSRFLNCTPVLDVACRRYGQARVTPPVYLTSGSTFASGSIVSFQLLASDR